MFDDEDDGDHDDGNDDDETKDHMDRVLVRNRGEDREVGAQDALESPESLFCQYLALEVYPDAAYVMSGYHAGQGQVAFGADYRRRADCLVAVDELRHATGDGWPSHQKRRVRHLYFHNLHGMWFHRGGRHLEHCQRRRTPTAAAAAGSTVPLPRDDGDDGDDDDEDDGEEMRRARAAMRGNDGQDQQQDQQQPPPNNWQVRKEADDLEHDALKTAYAAALTSVDPDALVLKYMVTQECDFLHLGTAPDPATWRPRNGNDSDDGEAVMTRAYLRKQERLRQKREAAMPPAPCWRDYPDPRALLAGKHPVDSLLGYKPRRMTQRTLVKRLLAAGFNATPGVEMGGFVVVEGGEESETGDGVLPGAFSFCHQRTGLPSERLGAFTAMQARMHWGKTATPGDRAAAAAADKYSADKLEAASLKPGTLSRGRFHGRGTALSADFFRFLVLSRGFRNYRIRHFIYYAHKHYLSPYVTDLVQRRHTLKMSPNPSPLLLDQLKLLFNGLYGYLSLEPKNFPRTRIVSELTLAKKGGGTHRLGGDVYEVGLLGALDRGRRRPPDLLYSINTHRSKAKTANVLQWAGSILGESRNIFFGKLLVFLRYFDPRRLEIAYCDTDSVLLAVSDPDLSKLVRPEFAHRFSEIATFLFEDPRSERHQCGLLKVEGVWDVG